MRHFRIFVTILSFVLLLQSPARAMERNSVVAVDLPTFDVTLNGLRIDNTYSKYPLIVYKDITYFPMTYHGSRFMHLKANWYEPAQIHPGVLFVGYTNQNDNTWVDYPANKQNNLTDTAMISEIQIAVNTLDRDKFIDNSTEEYPLLNFRGITYFPLTWHFAVDEFGWEYYFDMQTGLTINSHEQFRPELEDVQHFSNSTPATALTLKRYVYSANQDEYVGYPYSNLGGAAFVYQRKNEKIANLSAAQLFDDGEYLFDRQLDENGTAVSSKTAPLLKDGVLTIYAVRTDWAGQQTVLMKIDLRNETLLP